MLEQLVEQLNEQDYASLQQELVNNGGEKFNKLLTWTRETEENRNEEALKNELNLSNSAYYTLKSRLIDKIQDFLFKTNADDRAELMINLSSIPYFTYNTPKITAIGLLERLEKELIQLDMPSELMNVYNSLKKLHHSSDKYFEYQQKYNKNVAYSLAIDKAEDLLLDFNKDLGDYFYSHNEDKITLLGLYIKELRNINKLYDSSRLKLFKIVAEIQYAIFLDELNNIPDSDETVEELLKQAEKILFSHPEDRQYKFYILIYHFLVFEYYHKLKLHKNNQAALAYILDNIDTFFYLSNTFCLSKMLITVNERGREMNEQDIYTPFIKNRTTNAQFFKTPDLINDAFGSAAHDFALKNYGSAETTLYKVMNDLSLKHYFFAEIELKLFLSLVLLLQKKFENAEIVLRSITRKLSASDSAQHYQSAILMSKLLNLCLGQTKSKEEKVKKLIADYHLFNSRQPKILSYIKITEEHIKILSQ